MADRFAYPFVRKVMMISIALWTSACALMYWTMPSTSRGKTTAVFLVIYLVPLAVMLGLLQISRWYEGKFPTPPPKRKSKRPQKSRK